VRVVPYFELFHVCLWSIDSPITTGANHTSENIFWWFYVVAGSERKSKQVFTLKNKGKGLESS
jgi:hypothetical protein